MRFAWETKRHRTSGVIGGDILQGLRTPFSWVMGAQPLEIARHCPAFARCLRCVIGCNARVSERSWAAVAGFFAVFCAFELRGILAVSRMRNERNDGRGRAEQGVAPDAPKDERG
jgi:hypothetical protein